MMKLL